jgi:cell division cycle-associated protein 7
LASAAVAMEDDEEEEDEKLNMVVDKKRVEALQERRCDSRGRGCVYDPLLGICCHFCR